LFDAVLEPVEAVETAGQNPGVLPMLFEELPRFGNRAGLEQLEPRHDIVYDSH
jgi:hypothetical protein